MGFLDTLRASFGKTTAPVAIERSAPLDPFGAFGSAVVGGSSQVTRRGREEILSAYADNPTLRLSTHAAASAVARIAWRVYRPKDDTLARSGFLDAYRRTAPTERAALRRRSVMDGSLIELPHHPMQKLIDTPNASMSGFAFRLLAEVHYRLLGEWAAIIVRDGDEPPSSMWLIPTTWIREFPTKSNPTFLVDMTATGGTFVGRVPVDSLIYVRDHDPANPYGRGLGGGISLANEIDVDEHAARMISSFFQNGGVPTFIVSMEGAGTAALERAKAKWLSSFRGFQRAYQTFFTGTKLSAQRLDTSFKDMALVDIRRAQRDLMISSSGMPPEKVGVLTSSNRATIEAADVIEAKNVIIPALEVIRLEFQARLAPLYDSRLIVDYDDPTPTDIDREHAVMTTSSHVFTIDELRALASRPPLPDGKGEAFLVDPGKVYVRSLDELASGTPVFGYHMSGGVLTNNEMREKLGLPPTAEEWGTERTVGFYSPPIEFGDDDDALGVDSAPEADAPSTLADLAKSERVARARAARVSTRAKRTGVSRSILRRILAAIRAGDLARDTTPEIRALMATWGQETIESISNTAKFDPASEAMQGYVDDYASERVAMINATTRGHVERVLKEWDGDDVESVLDALSDVFTTARVERSQVIASVESVRASQFAAVEAYKQSGIVAEKEWIAVADGRTREAHLALDGQVVDLDKPFSVPSGEWAGAEAMQPGGFGVAALDINCRCQSAPIFDEDTKARTAEQRAAIWEERDAKLRRLEARVRDSFEDAFTKQEERTLDVARALLDD